MNEIEANQLLNELISVDKILFDQQLILDWEGPLLQVYTKYDLPSYRNASKLIKLEDKSLEIGKLINLNISTTSEESRHNLSLIKTMIKQISNRTKWLMDDQIDELLKPYINDNEKCLVKIDNVFTALNIESMEEILLLKSYLMLYAWCPNCTPSRIATDMSEHLHEINVVPPSVTENLDMSAIISSRTSTSISDTILSNAHTEITDHSNLMEFIGVNDTLNDNEDQPGQNINVELQYDNTCNNHCLIVDSAYILTALRSFIKDKNNTINKNDKIVTMTERVNYKYITISRLLSSEDVIMFWKRFREIFAVQKIRLWNALGKGLAQYLEILQKRDKLQKECQFLRNQNAELKHLLQRHLPTINNNVDDSNQTNGCDMELMN